MTARIALPTPRNCFWSKGSCNPTHNYQSVLQLHNPFTFSNLISRLSLGPRSTKHSEFETFSTRMKRMLRFNVSRDLLRKLVKISCILQLFNAAMDYVLWINANYLVPSWTIATIVSGYSILLLSYDRLIKERPVVN